jgi:hypothetical protein
VLHCEARKSESGVCLHSTSIAKITSQTQPLALILDLLRCLPLLFSFFIPTSPRTRPPPALHHRYNRKMSDIDMTDSREHGWDESDESQINDELERRHYNCVDDFEIKCCKIAKVIAVPDLYTMYFEAKDLTLPLLPDDVQLPSYFAMYNEGIVRALTQAL